MTALILLKDWINTTVEVWKPIEGFPGYDVSNMGRVRTYWRTSGSGRSCVNGQIRGSWTQVIGVTPRLRKLYTDKDGYKTLTLRANDRDYMSRVHQLVGRAFVVNNRPNTAIIPNHINNVPGDNRHNNLSWMTISENTFYGNEIGVGMRGERHGMARLTEASVLEIRAKVKNHEDAIRYASKFGCTYQNIDRIIQRKTWAYV